MTKFLLFAMAVMAVVAQGQIPKVTDKVKNVRKPDVPKVEVPNVEAPKIEAPKVEAPKVEAPKFDASKLNPPKIDPLSLPMPASLSSYTW